MSNPESPFSEVALRTYRKEEDVEREDSAFLGTAAIAPAREMPRFHYKQLLYGVSVLVIAVAALVEEEEDLASRTCRRMQVNPTFKKRCGRLWLRCACLPIRQKVYPAQILSYLRRASRASNAPKFASFRTVTMTSCMIFPSKVRLRNMSQILCRRTRLNVIGQVQTGSNPIATLQVPLSRQYKQEAH
jgi:hypothetical protein